MNAGQTSMGEIGARGFGELDGLLGVLCPMHARLDPTGHIVALGQTLRKLRPDSEIVGQPFLEVFELLRPRAVTSMSDLLRTAGARLRPRFRRPPHTALKGVVLPLADGGAVVNLSLGISVIDAVQEYTLTSTDFAPTDLTMEMLYLVEAKSAAMAASRSLNQRLQGAMIAAEEQAFTDTLTGLKNRRALGHVLSRLNSARAPFALLHLDLDYFKAVNDTLGHAAGDHVLQEVARVMVHETRDKDTVARVGGDEFVLILADLEDRNRVKSIARRLIERLQEPIPFGNDMCRVAASIGVALSGQRPRDEAGMLIGDADAALYEAKRAGRACFRFYDPNVARMAGGKTVDRAVKSGAVKSGAPGPAGNDNTSPARPFRKLPTGPPPSG